MPSRPRLTAPIANARRAIREAFATSETKGATSVLLAVSGGADSMALALACAFELPKLGIGLSAAIINHNLQAESKEIALRAKEQLATMGVASVVIDIKVPKSKQGPEAAARLARYAALEKQREKLSADFILTGHNLDDQAETVLLGLTRGSGLRSIAGMKLLDGRLMRPLLGIEKAQLEAACKDSGVDYWQDPHNEDSAFTRVRIRKLMQLIEAELGPGVSQNLAKTAALASEVDDYLTQSARELIASAWDKTGYKVELFANAHPALRTKALQLICVEHGAKAVSYAQVKTLEALITNWHGQKPVSLSGITVERVSNQLLIRRSH